MRNANSMIVNITTLFCISVANRNSEDLKSPPQQMLFEHYAHLSLLKQITTQLIIH